METHFSTDWGWVSGDGFGMIQMHFISCALYIYYYYISSTSDHYAKTGEPCCKAHRFSVIIYLVSTC